MTQSSLRGFHKSFPGPVQCVKLYDSNSSFCSLYGPRERFVKAPLWGVLTNIVLCIELSSQWQYRIGTLGNPPIFWPTKTMLNRSLKRSIYIFVPFVLVTFDRRVDKFCTNFGANL